MVRTLADVKAQFKPITIPDAVVQFLRQHFGLRLHGHADIVRLATTYTAVGGRAREGALPEDQMQFQ